jgi:serine/threonine-protein kinase
MENQKKQLSEREMLITAIALQNDLIDPQKISAAIEQSMVETDCSYTDALKQITGLDDDSFATLDHLADLKTARKQGDEEAALLHTLDRTPMVKHSLMGLDALDATTWKDSRAAETNSMDLDTLPISERYDLSSVHARGGLGQVWRAHDRLLSREVAIKEILPSATKMGAVRQRFLREATITGQLEHPGIVPVYDIGRLPEQDQPFYAMRFVDGETLYDRIKTFHEIPVGSEESSLQLRQLLNTMVSICNAVGFAHSRKVLHRDLKPQNVVLGSFGEVSVLDWGLACRIGSDDDEIVEANEDVAHEDVKLTTAGSIMGTPAYMAPEQAKGETDKLTEATDIYALGAILYQILTGEPPFVAPDYKELIRKIIAEPLVSPREKNPNVPRPLASICLKALEKISTDRYRTATEMANDINRFLADEKVSVHHESLIEQSRRWVRHHRTLVASAAAAMLVAMIGLLVASILLNAAREREVVAKQEIANQKSDIERARQDLEKNNVQLKAANQKVEKSLQDARDAIDNWYTIVATNKELKDSPKSSAFRKQLLQKASDYYETFLNELPDNESLQISAAQSHIRLATIKLELEPGLAAVPHFEKAEEIYASLLNERPADRELKVALAGVFNDKSAAFYQVNQMEKSLDLLKKVEDIYTALNGQSPEDAQLKGKLATVIANRAEIFLKLNKLPECIELFTQAIATHEQLVAADFEVDNSLQAIGNCHYRRGAAQIKLKRFDLARTDLEKAIEIRTDLSKRDPADPEYRSDLANVLADYGTLALATGDIPKAQETYREMIEISAGLAADFPTVPGYIQNLVIAHGNLARSYSIAKELGLAQESYQSARRISRELAQQFPDVPQYVSQQSDIAINYGILLANLGRNEEAIEQFEDAVQVQKQLVNDHPQIIRYALALVNTQSNLAAMHLRNNDLEKSNEAAETLIADCTRFVERWPDSVDLQLTLAAVYSNRAATRSQMVNPEGVEEDFQAALKIRKSLSTEYPDNNEVLADLAESYNNYGIYLTFQSHVDKARVFLEQAVDVRKQLAERQPGVAADTDVAVSTFALGQAYMHQDPQRADALFTDAIDRLVKAIGRSPQFSRAQQYLVLAGQSRAWVRWELGETKNAISDFEQLLSVETPRIKHETRASLAYFYLKSGKFEKGTRFLDEAQLESIVTARSQIDFAAAHALQRRNVLADDSIEENQRNQRADEHLQRSIAGIKAALASPDITSRESWESISNNEDFASIASSDEFQQLRD